MKREPLFNFSEPLPVWLGAIFLAVHVFLSFAPRGLSRSIESYTVLQRFGVDNNSVADFTRLVGHGFLHGSWSHVLMNTLMTIIFGIITIRGAKMLAASRGRPAKGDRAFLLIFLAGVLLGGMAQWLQWGLMDTNGLAVGASGGASALFATTAWALGGKDQTLKFGVGWAFINVVMVVAEPILGISIAWAAHMGGYLAGALLAPFFIRADSTRFVFTQ